MKKPLVKICGVTRVKDAQLAAALGADFVGVVFAGPRQVDIARAGEISRALPERTRLIGVFTETAKILATVEACGLGGVQLHGLTDLAGVDGLIEELRRRETTVIQAHAVDSQLSREAIASSRADIALFDAPRPGAKARAALDSKLLKSLAPKSPFFIAGGLNPENVAAYVAELEPAGVDVSSGVESAPGIKDESLLREFFARLGAS